MALSREQRYDEAEIELAAAVEDHRRSGSDRDLALGIWRLASVHLARGNAQRALQIGTEADGLWSACLGTAGKEKGAVAVEAARGCADLSTMAVAAGDVGLACELAQRAVQNGEIALRAKHPDAHEHLGTACHGLAVARLSRSDLPAAADAIERAMSIRRERAASSAHPSVADWELANSLLTVAAVALAQSRPDEAAAAVAEAVEIAGSLGAAGVALITKSRVLMHSIDAPSHDRQPRARRRRWWPGRR